MAAIAQTIAIVDRSGKVVSSSKQLKNVFFEAKLAYQERKAEIKAERQQKEARELQKAIKAMSVADTEERSEMSRSRTRMTDSGRRRRRSSAEHSQYRPEIDRQYSAGSSRHRHGSGSSSPRSPNTPNLAQFNHDLYGANHRPRSISRSTPVSPLDEPSENQLLRRTQTDTMSLQMQQRPNQNRSYSATDIDMDLAYGEFHAPDLVRQQSLNIAPEKELSGLILKCQGLLDEAQCASYSVKKIVAHLQENPDAMAAVALTLAEISNIARKMAPGALMAFKGSAPAVLALLAAPEFLIAVGVGVGITVVMFGGYKIIKKIKEKKLNGSDENVAKGVSPNGGSMDEAIDVKELDHIEMWRRGIAENELDDGRSVISGYSATSVEGEFISPFAQRSMGHLPLPAAKSSKSKSEKSKKDKDKDKVKEKKKKERKRDDASEVGSESSKGSAKDKQIIKVKKPSPLRRMFTAPNSTRS